MSSESTPESKEPSPAPEVSSSKEPTATSDASESDVVTEPAADSAQPPAESNTAAPVEQDASSSTSATGGWQAIYSPQYNAYYFYNTITQETTWTNPLQPPTEDTASTSETGPSSEEPDTSTEQTQPSSLLDSHYVAMRNGAIAQGIDPALAYLDPSFAASTSAGGTGVAGLPPSFQAKFNARTGQFAAMDSRTPQHLSEYERAKRMSEVFFDVAAWEQNLANERAEEEEAGKKRKRPTKKDLERFKEQKRLKRIAKTAWLRT